MLRNSSAVLHIQMKNNVKSWTASLYTPRLMNKHKQCQEIKNKVN